MFLFHHGTAATERLHYFAGPLPQCRFSLSEWRLTDQERAVIERYCADDLINTADPIKENDD